MTALAMPGPLPAGTLSGPSTALLPVPASPAPLMDAITRYRGLETGALHVPGHAGGGVVGPELRAMLGTNFLASDVWLTPADLAVARHDAEALAAQAWGAETALFLLDGSSGGNRAVHLAQQHPLRPGGEHVVVARDSHTSTLAGLVSLVSPGYAGACSDVRALAAVAHAHGALLHVDEAWGAHLPFHPDLPRHALSLGADIVVVSAHKMLPAASGAAIVFVGGGRADAGRISRAVRMTQSTSPLLPVLASIDDARRTMVDRGRALLDRTLQLAADARRRLSAIPGVRVAHAADLGVGPERFDPLRLVVGVRGLGLTGLALEKLLRSPGPGLGTGGLLHPAVAVEGADEGNLFVVITTGTRPEVIDGLVAGLRALSGRNRRRLRLGWDGQLVEALLAPRAQACTPREAHFASTEFVPLRRAVGRISAEPITPYPPGVPAVMPGERLDRDAVKALSRAVDSGMHIHGAADPTLTTVGVLRA